MSSIQLTPEVEEKLQALAHQRGVTISEVHKQAVDAMFRTETTTTEPRSNKWDDVIGVVDSVPVDLSARSSDYFGLGMLQKHVSILWDDIVTFDGPEDLAARRREYYHREIDEKNNRHPH